MGNYKFCIAKQAEEYVFILYPNNNNNQEIGRSNGFPTESDAKEGLYQFQQFIKNNQNNLQNYLEVPKNEKQFYCRLTFNNGIFFRKKEYLQKTQYKKWLQRISDNIDAPIKDL